MKLFLFLIAVCFSFTLSAQSFFKPIPKKATVAPQLVKGKGIMATATVDPVPADVTFWSFRPVASAVTLYIDGEVQAAAGGGFSYQNITQRGSDGRSYVNYSANLIVAAGGAVTENSVPSSIGKVAFYIGALNNTVGLGYGMSRQADPITLQKKWKGGLAVVWTYNFNN